MKSNKMMRKLTPKMWKREEIHAFLNEYKTAIEHSRDNPFDDEEHVWHIVSEKLKDQGINVSAAHCHGKWNFLFKTYVVNPHRDCAFNKQIKQILEISQDITEARESNDAILEVEQDPRSQHDVSNEDGANIDYDLEELDLQTEESVSPPFKLEIESLEAHPDEEVSIMSLLQTLCNRIDTLTEMQTRQEARIEQVYRLQKENQESLLDIKKHFDIR